MMITRLWEFKMSKTQNTPIQQKSQSIEHANTNKITSRKGSGFESETSHLLDLKDKGKRVLKKLIPNQPIVMIKKLVERGKDLKREILHNHKLLPSLTLKSMQAEYFEKMIPQNNSFQEMNQKITHSMLFFQQAVCGEAEEGEILKLQTQKCYRKIPRYFFDNEISSADVSNLLTRDKRESIDLRDELSDYYDEVEFNVNQQVAYKMKIFMTFVSFLTSIGNLADLSIMKIKGTRIKNNMIREIVVQRSERVNSLRTRKEQIERSLAILFKLKKLKRYENLLMSQVQAKGKITLADTYKQYAAVHEQIKEYCCSRLICKYWDVTYYIERGYHDSFSKSLKNYIREIIILDENQIRNIIQPKKQDYMTLNPIRTIDDVDINLDESYQIDEADVELITKHNIEREIVSVFKQGLHKCTYSTDEICEEIRLAIHQCENKLYRSIKGDQNVLANQLFNENEKKTILDKLTFPKYVKIVEEWSDRMKKIVRRETSVIERALAAAKELRRQFPEKEEVICSYLMQILYITFLEIDESIAFLIKSRKLKLHEADSIRQLLLCSQQWKDLILDFKNFPCIWEQLIIHFVEDRSDNKEAKIIQGILNKFLATRRKIVELMIDAYNKASIENLPLRLQEDQWKTISIPNRYYNTLGEILYGSSFSKHIESVQRKLLSSSLLLERNSSLMITHQQESRRDVNESNDNLTEFDLQVSENIVTLLGESFKIISSSLALIDFIHGFLEWVDEAGEGELLESTVLSKIMEFIIMYNENIKKLILQKEALNYGKLKSKSITGKHLVTAYSQLKLFKILTLAISKRFQSFRSLSEIIQGLLNKNMNEVSKKFRSILQLTINESVIKIVVDPRKQITGPVQQSIEIVTAMNRSSEYVKDILLSSKEMGQFVGVLWCQKYLQQVKTQYKSVYKSIMSSEGKRRSKDIDWSDNIYWKFKELEYIVQNLSEFRSYLVGFDVIIAELEDERKKLENPQ